MRKKAASFLAIVLLVLSSPAAVAKQSSPVSAETQLLTAMKLWGNIRLFDPQASDGTVDWDAAFMNAEPALLAARDSNAYRTAIEALIAPLNDPATHVIDASAASARVSASSIGAVGVVRIPRGAGSDWKKLEDDSQLAVAAASKSRNVLIDIRGITESNGNDGDVLSWMFSDDGSPIWQLFPGEIGLPRTRTRSYVGYPAQAGPFPGGSAADQVSDSQKLAGKSHEHHRFGFLVDSSTSLPWLAISLSQSGNAAIYSTGGQPSVLSTGSAEIDLPYGVKVSYRTGDLADIATNQQFASVVVRDANEAAARLGAGAPAAAVYATPAPAHFADDPYASTLFPNEPMRMLGVARIYNAIRYFSPYTSLMHDDWDAAALQAIGDERAAGNAREYVLGLMQFYAHLHDSHGSVFGPTVWAEFGAGPPFHARFLHRQVVVDELYATGTALGGLRVGDVIETVDGVPVRQAMNRVEAYICASTPQAADARALLTQFNPGPSIFKGPTKTTLVVRFHHPGGRSAASATFERNVAVLRPPSQAPKYQVLPGNVGYVAFDRLEVSEVDAMFAALKNTRAIIFDNRGYPRSTTMPVTSRLATAASVRAALSYIPFVSGPLEGADAPLPTYQEGYAVLERTSPTYLGPTVMLIDERAMSQSENSALFFRAANHTRFVGTPTIGADGDVTALVAPGGVGLLFSGLGVRWPDGRQLQRVGILPDVRVEPTALDIASGNDVVLQRGLDEALRLSGASVESRKTAVRQEIVRERSAFQVSEAAK
jgi:hypothetical protein